LEGRICGGWQRKYRKAPTGVRKARGVNKKGGYLEKGGLFEGTKRLSIREGKEKI